MWFCLSLDGNGGDNGLGVFGDAAVIVHGSCVGADGIHHFDALGDIAEHRIAAVKECGVLMDDEELGAGAVGVLGAGHGDGASGVAEGVVDAVLGKLALDFCIGAAGAVAQRIAALDHEAFNDAVEGQAVVEAGFGKGDEVCNADGGGTAVQLKGDAAVVFYLDDGGAAFNGLRDFCLHIGGGSGGGLCHAAAAEQQRGKKQRDNKGFP